MAKTKKTKKTKKLKTRTARTKTKAAVRRVKKPATKKLAARAKVKKRPAVRRAAKPAKGKKKSKLKVKVKMALPVLAWREALPGEILVGTVEDFLTHLSVMLCTIKVPLAVGDTLHIRGFTTDLTEKITSIQVEHQAVPQAGAGQDVGIQLVGKVRKHDFIYRVTAAPAPAAPAPAPGVPPSAPTL
jgi:hypothetical protein